MKVLTGKSYHINDAFFSLVNDQKLMTNKEFGNYRPHFFFFEDPNTKGIFWAIPQSSKVEKYKKLIQEKLAKHKSCDTIVLGNFGGKDNAFLIQNMFPIIDKYVDHEHLINGISVPIHDGFSKKLISKALKILSLHNKGHNFIFPNVDRILEIMKNELNN